MNEGMFLGTTQSWDVLKKIDQIGDYNLKELFLLLYQSNNNIIMALNKKDTGIYSLTEFVNGQTFPPLTTVAGEVPREDRQVIRLLLDIDGLPNGGTKTVPHGITSITNQFTATRIYGSASDTAALEYIPLPYVSSTDPVELKFDSANVIITTLTNMTRFSKVWIVLEFLKN